MQQNVRSILAIITAILFTLLVLMMYIGVWSANLFMQNNFFFCMLISVLNVVLMIDKKPKRINQLIQGLQEPPVLIKQIYAQNTVPQVLSRLV